MSAQTDYLIVGQGLAGTILAYSLLQKKQTFHIIDAPSESASSAIAAGIINPITGRRFVKSWMIDELLPYAKKTYKDIEQLLNISILKQRNVERILFNQLDENEWMSRNLQEDYKAYIENNNDSEWENILKPFFGIGFIKKAHQVDFPLLIQSFRDFFIKKRLLSNTTFEYKKIEFKEENVFYNGMSYKKILFCEGAMALDNPYFSYLPFHPTKGEVLIVKIPNFKASSMLKHSSFIVPIGNDNFWVGSSYGHNYENHLPTEKGKEKLIQYLEKTLKIPYQIVSHKAAVRPTVKDRRPLLGQHPKHSTLYLFNGLGTKGASLAPYWAKHLVEHLVEGKPISKEASINRHKSLLL